MRLERLGSGVGVGAGQWDGGSGVGVGTQALTPGGIQNKRSRPLLPSSSTSSGLDSRSGNPSISHRVERSSRLGSEGGPFSGLLSALIDIARGGKAPTVMVVPL